MDISIVVVCLISVVILVSLAWPDRRFLRGTTKEQLSPTMPVTIRPSRNPIFSTTEQTAVSPDSIDYDAWDMAPEFELWQAACLWAGVRPTRPVPEGKADAVLQIMRLAIGRGKMRAELSMNLQLTMAASLGKGLAASAIEDHIIVTRNSLKKYAKSINQTPRFLFQEER